MPGLFGMYGSDGIGERSAAIGAAADAQRAASQARDAEQRVKALEESLAKTLLICESLLEILRERSGLTEDDLYQKLREIDLRDGVLDEKNQTKPTECPSCQRRLSNRHARCLYCGHTFEKSTFAL
ncbi:MAG: hypothetical protein JNL67_03515 [Planctomycetaceae bacterium]|nr:hypothetical protein [Planctomycetaceae bacterium]